MNGYRSTVPACAGVTSERAGHAGTKQYPVALYCLRRLQKIQMRTKVSITEADTLIHGSCVLPAVKKQLATAPSVPVR